MRMVRGDDGSSSVLVLGVGTTLLLVGSAVALVGSAVVARHRAQNAADLAALAAALTMWEGGEGAACRRAVELVVANGGRLTQCRSDGLDVIVTAEVAPGGLGARFGAASATARAGPVQPS